MNQALFRSIAARVQAAYDAANGAGSFAALPPGTIIAIINAILTAISGGGCIPTPTPPAIKAACADPANLPLLVFYVSRELVTQCGRPAARHAHALAVAIQATCAEAADADLTAVSNAAQE